MHAKSYSTVRNGWLDGWAGMQKYIREVKVNLFKGTGPLRKGCYEYFVWAREWVIGLNWTSSVLIRCGRWRPLSLKPKKMLRDWIILLQYGGAWHHMFDVSCQAAIVPFSSSWSLCISVNSWGSGPNRRSCMSSFCRRWRPLEDRSRDSCTYIEQYFRWRSCPRIVGSSLRSRIAAASVEPCTL
jgi:hypothetical protein